MILVCMKLKKSNLDIIILLHKMISSQMRKSELVQHSFYSGNTSVHKQTYIKLVEFQFQNVLLSLYM